LLVVIIQGRLLVLALWRGGTIRRLLVVARGRLLIQSLGRLLILARGRLLVLLLVVLVGLLTVLLLRRLSIGRGLVAVI